LQANIVIPVKNSPLQSSIGNLFLHITYHKLAKGVNVTALEQDFTLAAHEKVAYVKNLGMQIKLQPLKDIHFKKGMGGDIAVTGSETEVMVFISVAAVILLLSCINFTNLFVSNSFLRAKSIGIKQVMGAHRSTLRKEFYFENENIN
jgi:putative ABC transport system permease protein